MDKKTLREKAKQIRSGLNIAYYSEKLTNRLMLSNEYKNAKHIMAYYPKNGEIDLREIFKDKSKSFYLPKIDGKNLLCCPFNSDTTLCKSCFSTMEPLTEPCKKTLIDLVIVPALAVDRNNYRLGYGGGFYDRFLNDFCGDTVVCIPKELVFETIYPETFDINVKKIIVN